MSKNALKHATDVPDFKSIYEKQHQVLKAVRSTAENGSKEFTVEYGYHKRKLHFPNLFILLFQIKPLCACNNHCTSKGSFICRNLDCVLVKNEKKSDQISRRPINIGNWYVLFKEARSSTVKHFLQRKKEPILKIFLSN